MTVNRLISEELLAAGRQKSVNIAPLVHKEESVNISPLEVKRDSNLITSQQNIHTTSQPRASSAIFKIATSCIPGCAVTALESEEDDTQPIYIIPQQHIDIVPHMTSRMKLN